VLAATLSAAEAKAARQGAATAAVEATRAHRRLIGGAGFFIGADGTFVTSAGAVRGSDAVAVHLPDGSRAPARVVGVDPRTDIAVLKVAAKPRATLKLAPAARLDPGARVDVLGPPQPGRCEAVSARTIRVVGRPHPRGVPPALDQLIELEAALPQSLRGAPLIDASGGVVGMVVLIADPGAAAEETRRALPLSALNEVVGVLRAKGRVARGWLGAAAYPAPTGTGARLGALVADGPGAAAGLEPGDLVLTVAGRPCESSAALASAFAERVPGTSVVLEVMRGEAHRTVTVTVGTAPHDVAGGAVIADTPPPLPWPGIGLRAGADSACVTSPVVSRVEVGSPADRAGLRPGDVITHADAAPVAGASELARTLRSRPARLTVVRAGRQAPLEVALAVVGR
jgi:serine protease Do